MSQEHLPARMMRERPILLGYVAAIVTIELLWKVAEWVGWIR